MNDSVFPLPLSLLFLYNTVINTYLRSMDRAMTITDISVPLRPSLVSVHIRNPGVPCCTPASTVQDAAQINIGLFFFFNDVDPVRVIRERQ